MPGLRISRRSALTALGAGLVSPAIASTSPAQLPEDVDALKYGRWTHDDAGLPCFDADLEKCPVPDFAFSHLLSTGTTGALLDQFGCVRFFSCEAGLVTLTPQSLWTLSGLYAMLSVRGELFSLVYSQLDRRLGFRYGIGYAEYRGALDRDSAHLEVSAVFYTPPDDGRGLIGTFSFRNTGSSKIAGEISIRSDVFIRPGTGFAAWTRHLRPVRDRGYVLLKQAHPIVGDVFLIGEEVWVGDNWNHRLLLRKNVALAPGETLRTSAVIGYGAAVDVAAERRRLTTVTPRQNRKLWKQKLSSFRTPTPESWAGDECVWTLGQLHGFVQYDGVQREHYVHLGGYAFGDLDSPFAGQTHALREPAEDVLVLAYFDPDLAKSSLRWVAKAQLPNGDLPREFDPHRPAGGSAPEESDNEIWFALAACEYVVTTGDAAFFDDVVPFWKGDQTTVWEHLKRASRWIVEDVGVGSHGLILNRRGDWNDYLSLVGAAGRGESVMNSGMAARAFDLLARFAVERHDAEFARQVANWRDSLRKAVAEAFDREWFVGYYGDDGAPMCGYGDRLYLNAQSWAALGKCGTAAQRRIALQRCAEHCGTRIGMTLLSRPYSSPAPESISWCPISAGEGENGGIWPQTAYWAIWAMAEEGLISLALEQWKKMSLRNHAASCPDPPFGIYNGPDCYSSGFAGPREGWTQTQLIDRAKYSPMNPMIAWQAFALQKIHEGERSDPQPDPLVGGIARPQADAGKGKGVRGGY